MFLDVFWTLHDAAKVFGANVYGQELQCLFAKYTCCMLRICKWIWDVFGATSFSWMCMMFLTTGLTRFSTTNWNQFFCQAAFTFSGSCMSFYNNFMDEKNVFEIFEMVLERLRWIQHMWIHPNGNGQQFECEWMRIYFSFSAAIAKTAKLKQERHNTVHGAWQTNKILRFVSCVEKSWATSAVRAVVLGFCVFV